MSSFFLKVAGSGHQTLIPSSEGIKSRKIVENFWVLTKFVSRKCRTSQKPNKFGVHRIGPPLSWMK
jgi:hypothetical protein